MAKSSNQKIRILYLMRLLLEQTDDRHGLTLTEMEQALAQLEVPVERKALYDDLEVLRLYGLDIEKRKDTSVHYHVVNRSFELPELKLLVDAVQASKFITHRKSAELIKKLEEMTSRHEARQLHRQVFVVNRIKTMNESIYYTVDAIHDAISRNVQIRFRYFEWTADKEKKLRRDGEFYLISPWALTWDDENYYMIGYDSQENKIKHYRVDKMTQVQLSDCPREGGGLFEHFDMAVYSKKTFGMYGGQEESVTLLCKNHLAGVMIDRFGRDVSIFRQDGEHFRMNVRVNVSPVFLSWLMTFGDEVKVLAPEGVIGQVKALAQSVLSQYG